MASETSMASLRLGEPLGAARYSHNDPPPRVLSRWVSDASWYLAMTGPSSMLPVPKGESRAIRRSSARPPADGWLTAINGSPEMRGSSQRGSMRRDSESVNRLTSALRQSTPLSPAIVAVPDSSKPSAAAIDSNCRFGGYWADRAGKGAAAANGTRAGPSAAAQRTAIARRAYRPGRLEGSRPTSLKTLRWAGSFRGTLDLRPAAQASGAWDHASGPSDARVAVVDGVLPKPATPGDFGALEHAAPKKPRTASPATAIPVHWSRRQCREPHFTDRRQ